MTAGQTYTFTAYARATPGSFTDEVRLFVAFYNDAGTQVGAINTVVDTSVSTSSWTKFSGTLVVPAGATKAALNVNQRVSVPGDVFYVDGMMVEPGDTTSYPYFDGAAGTGASWTGTAHGSTSTMSAAQEGTCTAISRTCTVTGLVQKRMYTGVVRARTAGGWGPYSAQSAPASTN